LKIVGIIPARYESSRFPGKPLAMISGKSMIQRVYEQAKKATSLTEVYVATDDERIIKEVETFGGQVIMTAKEHLNGTSRCAEAIEILNKNFNYIINIQGDEPLINPNQINELASLFLDEHAEIITQVAIETDLSFNREQEYCESHTR
jgi:3-deoxy-manno-octulosonate cytidylyltransferase (CMP-KDO synthetase)